MTFTAGQLVLQIEHEIGGPVATELGGGLAVVNWAGRHMYGMRRWASALRASTTLPYVANQNYVTLPTDYGELEHVREGNLEFRLVQPHELSRMVAAGGAERVGAIAYDGTNYVLYLASTPTAAEADALTIVYRKKWVDLADHNQTVGVPVWMEFLMRRLVSAVARGLEAGTTDEELMRVETSPVYAACVTTDALGAGTAFGYVHGSGGADMTLPDPYNYIRDTLVT